MKYTALLLLCAFSVSAHAQSLQVSPSTIVWSKVANPDTLTQAFTVTNTGGGEASGTFGMMVGGKFDSVQFPFSILEGHSFTIAGGSNQTFHVLFVPNGALGGNWQDTVLLNTGGSGPFSQFTINASRYNVNTGNVQYSTVDLDFGTIMAGTSDTEWVYAKNVGTTVLNVTADNLAHTGPFYRFGKPINSRVVNPGDSLAIGLRFVPLVAGAFHDTVKTSSNDLAHPNINIALHGIATPAAAVLPNDKPTMLEVFPTITNSTLFIRTENSGSVEIRVVDLLGRECLRTQLRAGEEAVDVASLTNGVYLCLIRTPLSTSTARFEVSR